MRSTLALLGAAVAALVHADGAPVKLPLFKMDRLYTFGDEEEALKRQASLTAKFGGGKEGDVIMHDYMNAQYYGPVSVGKFSFRIFRACNCQRLSDGTDACLHSHTTDPLSQVRRGRR